MQQPNVALDTARSLPRTRLLTVAEVAGYLAVSRSSVRQLATRRQLAFIRVGRQLRFRLDDLAALEEKLRTETLEAMLAAEPRLYGRPQVS
jgi:excisionase family DNA binding protein